MAEKGKFIDLALEKLKPNDVPNLNGKKVCARDALKRYSQEKESKMKESMNSKYTPKDELNKMKETCSEDRLHVGTKTPVLGSTGNFCFNLFGTQSAIGRCF